jgi:hypothetical protein
LPFALSQQLHRHEIADVFIVTQRRAFEDLVFRQHLVFIMESQQYCGALWIHQRG